MRSLSASKAEMGASHSAPAIEYSTLVPGSRVAGSGGVFRNKTYAGELKETINADVRTLWDNFLHGVSANPSGNCLGTRVDNGPYTWITYT